jgi:hypothetical protein
MPPLLRMRFERNLLDVPTNLTQQRKTHMSKKKIQVERGIPLPPSRGGASIATSQRSSRTGRPPIYPFRAMEREDSFLVPAKNGDRTQTQKRLSTLSSKYKPHRFATRIEERGVRVWRVS